MGDDSSDAGQAVLMSISARLDELSEELRAVRTAVDEVIARLDEGLVLADELVTPPSLPAELGDLISTIRDDMERGLTSLRDAVAARPMRSADADSVSNEVLDELRSDLAALRRRIKLRAEGHVFTDEQLEQIAESVARRLA